MLRGKNLFSKLSNSKSKKTPSELNTDLLKRSISMFEIRTRKRRLILATVLIPILFVITVFISVYLFT